MLPVIICDNAKEMALGKLNRKLKEASCHLRQTEPFTLCLNGAEREIKEQKKGSGKNLIKSSTSKRLWDNYLELESYIRSNTVYSIYKLNGKVSGTIILGETYTVSQFCELEWFEWVTF